MSSANAESTGSPVTIGYYQIRFVFTPEGLEVVLDTKDARLANNLTQKQNP